MANDSSRPSVFVTGATGFIGRFAIHELKKSGFDVRCAVRRHQQHHSLDGTEFVELPDLQDLERELSCGSWVNAMRGANYVVHLAAVAHVRIGASNPSELFELVNSTASGVLARCALEAGVDRFLYVSTAGVHGSRSVGSAISETSPLSPHDVYTRSKLAGEIAVANALQSSRTDWVVLRPPLVFGPNAPGNLRRLCRLIDARVPLPFASISNRRSMISVWNLADAIRVALRNPAAARAAWLVADDQPLSTPELVSAIASARGLSPRLVPFPVTVLRWFGGLSGRRQEVSRLCEDLLVDCNEVRSKLGWAPPVSTVEGLQRAFTLTKP